ncbi:hypothetical protein DLR11_25090 [Salmonella enterica subsp. salamae]|uniref:Uncharacterized protein n=2 Tax=Salmonella enterica subsp. salamae TaxID=59202 RepID=A0A6C7CAN0_SALER|nr:hypothetical protein [Salmonella enterica]ECC1483489.1 hypothetical protein [Salmonella enterica subsp. salamae]EHM1753560.1 hypothetical protein [Salmonella enterica subsp. salamae serovar 40:c:e,n,x,z15]HCM2001491.1 hypothetical protein [Salmonella enterica subsp. salamae serovar [1],40:z35:e,n,x,z15]ASG90148.1 hypothetical protein LFZ47_22810 [Salmonella enterica subsp. salamae serovar 55:k:z39 str. 1315K]ECC1658300.1 hypothetical protein [Salmonella enterica subsp. salamae]
METCVLMQLKNCIKCSIAHILRYKRQKCSNFKQESINFRHFTDRPARIRHGISTLRR